MTMDKGLSQVQVSKFWISVAAGLVFGGLLTCSVSIFSSYSYWLDELYSVTAANETLSALYVMLLGDVHPPLYQGILKLWVLIFGDAEPSTRALSFLLSIIAAVYLYRKASKHGRINSIVVLLLFTTNWLFIYYANETRSYAMMLFFATFLATNLPNENEKPSLIFYISSILLSLTHYFGFLMTGVVLALYLITHLKKPRFNIAVILTGLLCLIWPINHLVFGELLSKTNGNFWIKVNGILDSFAVAAHGYFPKTGLVGGLILIFALLLSLFIILRSEKTLNISDFGILNQARSTATISLAFIVLIAIIDVWSPMSTSRNYIVLLPFISLTLGAIIPLLMRNFPKTKNALFMLLIVYCSIALVFSFYSTRYKSNGIQDWQGASAFIANNHDGRDIYFVTIDVPTEWKYLISNYYLNELSGGVLKADNYIIGETKPKGPAIIIFGHLSDIDAGLLKEEMDALGAIQSYKRGIPLDLAEGQVGVYVVN